MSCFLLCLEWDLVFLLLCLDLDLRRPRREPCLAFIDELDEEDDLEQSEADLGCDPCCVALSLVSPLDLVVVR